MLFCVYGGPKFRHPLTRHPFMAGDKLPTSEATHGLTDRNVLAHKAVWHHRHPGNHIGDIEPLYAYRGPLIFWLSSSPGGIAFIGGASFAAWHHWYIEELHEQWVDGLLADEPAWEVSETKSI